MLNNVLMPEYPQIVSLPASPEGVVAQLETYRGQFLREAESVEKAAQAGNAAELQAFRDGWLGRKQGLLAQLNEHWLKPAPGEAKKLIGQQLNRLRGEAEAAMERIEHGGFAWQNPYKRPPIAPYGRDRAIVGESSGRDGPGASGCGRARQRGAGLAG